MLYEETSQAIIELLASLSAKFEENAKALHFHSFSNTDDLELTEDAVCISSWSQIWGFLKP